MDPLENVAAVRAADDARKCVLSAVHVSVSGSFPDARSAHYFLLHLHVDFPRDDGLVVVLHVVLRSDAVVDHPLFGQEVSGDRLLQERVTNVLLVHQDLLDGTAMPVFAACRGPDAVSRQPMPDCG